MRSTTTIASRDEQAQLWGLSRPPEQVRELFRRDEPGTEQAPSARDGWELERARAPSRRGARVSSSHDDDGPCARDKARGCERGGAN